MRGKRESERLLCTFFFGNFCDLRPPFVKTVMMELHTWEQVLLAAQIKFKYLTVQSFFRMYISPASFHQNLMDG